ncbi:MLO-like protein 4 isoform X2 [Carica papaya]|uniref:MLO-like protein 4 isoform X2 n=1 Tax=Carica papaya TaxID=3649 RepID=UPI000B8CA644|nr:MLO-like protein 4 isoform X2 [Carica papaya]
MEGRALTETPTWAVATVVGLMVIVGLFFHASLKRLRKWLDKTKRKPLLAALQKIKEELMLFGLMSLLMGHWIGYVAKLCVKSTALSTRFYPCSLNNGSRKYTFVSSLELLINNTVVREEEMSNKRHDYCPKGHESFASRESLEQLHRFMFVLGIIHVSYSFIAIVLAMIKIYSWRTWENQAKSMAIANIQDNQQATSHNMKMRRPTTFILHNVSHPWSRCKVLVWLLCFSRQFWSSINQADYLALRLGFITAHQLPSTYDFHSYMLRSMEEEFRDIVGISVPLWVYAILCIFLEFHGTDAYFWLSFVPAILILLIGMKLHRVVVKLAVETMDQYPWMGLHQFNLRDSLFWFGKPQLLLWLIQLISFQNAFEMATFVWSMWEIRDSSCFMEDRISVAIRLTFGVITQIWCSYITFPLYVIVTQMGSKFKKSVISENVRDSLSKWQKRVNAKRSSRHVGSSLALLKEISITPPDSSVKGDSPSMEEDLSVLQQAASTSHDPKMELSTVNDNPVEDHDKQNSGLRHIDTDPSHDNHSMENSDDINKDGENSSHDDCII